MTTAPQESVHPRIAEVEAIRAAFPALERRHGGEPVAYFDGPGGTQVPRSVVDAMAEYLLHHNANTHWAYPTSVETDATIAGARAAAADLLGARSDEIAFGANMTTLAFHLARALGRGWEAGDEVVVTELDHQANVAPWEALARERGIVLRRVPFDPRTGQLDWADFERAVGRRTRLVAVGGASNALGTVSDLGRAIGLARGVGALTFVDAVHLVPHVPVDVRALDCDFLACSAYKFYGPHVGLLYGRHELVARLDVPKLAPAPDTAPERLETGTGNHEGMAGTAAAIDFLASLADGGDRRERLGRAFAALHARGQSLTRRLWTGLESVPGVRCYGPPPTAPRTPTVSFAVEGIRSEEVARRLAERGLFVSHGDFYASSVLTRLGVPGGLVRAGCACYTTEEEVERLVAAVAALR
jgi:cysteine desulfurase family protein (TIGR01976 family)